MPTGSALTTDLREAIREVGQADLVVGIPSFNNAGTIVHVVHAAREGLRSAFPSLRAVLVNSDGGSADGTREAVAALDSPDLPILSGRYDGPAGKGSALRAVFEAVVTLDARAAAVLDSDLRSVTAAWVERLLGPIVRGDADYVTPLYLRHKHDGTITNNIVYPVVRALYGRRVRQPIGGEFGFAVDLARRFLDEDVWDGDVARFGIDVFMTTTALAGGARVVQAGLGAKIHDPKDPAVHLRPMFRQVLSGLIDRARAHESFWRGVRGSVALPVYGEPPAGEPDEVRVDLARLDEAYLSVHEAESRRRELFCADDLARFDAGARGRSPADDALERSWARLSYDALARALRDPGNAAAPVETLLPLYLARVAMHVRAAQGLTSAAAEGLVERQARAFESEKAHLLERLP